MTAKLRIALFVGPADSDPLISRFRPKFKPRCARTVLLSRRGSIKGHAEHADG